MLVGIHQPHYLPWLPYLAKLACCDLFILLDDVDFTKNGWQNRNRALGPQGPVLLTVPVSHRWAQKIREVELPSQGWRRKHWVSLTQSYARSPFFSTYRESLEALYQRPWTHLVELCAEMLDWHLQGLGLSHVPVVRSSELKVSTRGTERLADLVQRVQGTAYLSGRHALQQYLDPAIWEARGLELKLFDWQCPSYPQVADTPFHPNLACLDLLFRAGPGSLEILRQGARVT